MSQPHTVAILAGGKSSRMGTNKSFVPLLGRPMIAHIIDRVRRLEPAAIILNTNHPADYRPFGLPMFTDVLPGKGALGGIYTALHHSTHPYTLVVACDMPFINPDLLRYMLTLREEKDGPYDVIIPRVNDHPQGLHAVYSKACLEPIRAQLDADRLKVIGFHDAVRVRYLDPPEHAPLDPQGLSFLNINTPDELRSIQDKYADAPPTSDQG
ncbi:MAG: molybdenum cofactor guanylyltransferase [Anaerolineae bacterium]|nr:molybdenum cofactor guanylyltransferase [Anaerolineae bacterium]